MREFLSRNGIPFEERNVARDARWRRELVARRGELVVPVLVHGGEEVVGFDEDRFRVLLGLSPRGGLPPSAGRQAQPAAPTPPAPDREAQGWDGLDLPDGLPDEPAEAPEPLAGQLRHLLLRLQREMEFNASKGSSPYRQGQHDGMRFARDGLRRILDGSYEPEDLVIERVQRHEG